MLNFLILLNVFATAIVFGLAVGPTLIVHPAMMDISRGSAVEFFARFFNRSKKIQMVLSVVVLVLSILITVMGGSWWWLIGGLVLQISGPYTGKILMPVNNRIMAVDADVESVEMGNDLSDWGKLHLPRTLIAGVVFVLFLCVIIWR